MVQSLLASIAGRLQDPPRAILHLAYELPNESRLPDARLAVEADDLHFPTQCRGGMRSQTVHLLVASDEGRKGSIASQSIGQLSEEAIMRRRHVNQRFVLEDKAPPHHLGCGRRDEDVSRLKERDERVQAVSETLSRLAIHPRRPAAEPAHQGMVGMNNDAWILSSEPR